MAVVKVRRKYEMKNIMIAGAGVLGSQIAYQTALSGFNVSVYNHHIDTA